MLIPEQVLIILESEEMWKGVPLAHNTVAYNAQNSSEVWAGFRVADRARITKTEESSNSLVCIS